MGTALRAPLRKSEKIAAGAVSSLIVVGGHTIIILLLMLFLVAATPRIIRGERRAVFRMRRTDVENGSQETCLGVLGKGGWLPSGWLARIGRKWSRVIWAGRMYRSDDTNRGKKVGVR